MAAAITTKVSLGAERCVRSSYYSCWVLDPCYTFVSRQNPSSKWKQDHLEWTSGIDVLKKQSSKWVRYSSVPMKHASAASMSSGLSWLGGPAVTHVIPVDADEMLNISQYVIFVHGWYNNVPPNELDQIQYMHCFCTDQPPIICWPYLSPTRIGQPECLSWLSFAPQC